MRWIPAVLLVSGLLLGCGSDTRPSVPPPGVGDAPPPPPPPVAAAPVDASPSEPAAITEGEPAAVAEDETARPAEVGVGRKGHGYGTGLIATPLAARWRAAERLIFETQIPHAMNLFKATNGRAPVSHDEFMQEIIKFNQINLPELRDGERYQYDSETEQLTVVGAREQ